MSEPFLIGENMTGGYGPVDILHNCTIAVEKGQIAVIVGPNGAGKSTAMKAVFGMLNLRGGSVKLSVFGSQVVFGVGLAVAGVMTVSAWRLLREERKLPPERTHVETP